jgi:transcriptional regulator with XRE-family HTH domain
VTFPELLTFRRDELKLSRRAVAAEINTTELTVWRWETGAVLPRPVHYDGICNGYQIELDVLLASITESLRCRGAA